MREFMTKVSDYFAEWRSDPERKENRISAVVTGAVAVIIIALLLLLLWWGYSAQEKKKEESAKRAEQLQAAQKMQEKEEEQSLTATTYEEKMAEYMSMDSGEELRKEYLTNANALTEKIKELQETMERVQTEINTVAGEYHAGDGKTMEKLAVLERETAAAVQNISALEKKIADLSEALRTTDREKIPAIQKQLGALQKEMEQANADVTDVYEKIGELKKEDKKLWERLSEAEKSLETALGDNMQEIDTRLDRLGGDIGDLEREYRAALEKMNGEMDEKVKELTLKTLGYRYEQETNTLYLMPN